MLKNHKDLIDGVSGTGIIGHDIFGDAMSSPAFVYRSFDSRPPSGDADTMASASRGDDLDTMVPPDPVTPSVSEQAPVAGEQSFGLTPSSGAQQEVSFITGVSANGTLNATSFWGLNGQTAHKWGSATAGTAGGTVTFFFDPASNFTQTERTTFREAFALWSSVANVQFAEATTQSSAGVLLRRGSDGGAYESDQGHVTTGSGSTLGTHTGQSLLSIDTSVAGFDLSGSFDTVGGYGLQTVIHEIGHLLGLGHGGNYNGNVNPATQQFGAYDERSWTLMSYIYWGQTNAQYRSSYELTGTNWGTTGDGYQHQSSGTFMPLDILAIQQLYGAPTNAALAGFHGGQVFGFHSTVGDQTSGALLAPFYDFTINHHPVVTIYSQGTNNTLDLSGFTTNSTINLSPGSYSSADNMVNNIAIAYGTTVETAIGGSGNDHITGTAGNNVLVGGSGQDTLTGNGGNDIFRGTAADLNGDTITDFSSLDVIHVTNAGAALQALQYNGTTLSFQLAATGTQTYSIAVAGGVSGGVTQTADAAGGVDILFGAPAPAGSIAINDVSITEGDAGTSLATFTVTRSGGSGAFAVNYATADGTATAGSDYAALAGTLSFAAGVMSQTISVIVNGDTVPEPNETFFVNLSGATNGGTIADAQGLGTILNNDVRDDFADSLTDTTAPFGTVTAGGSATGELETAGDRDWFPVQLTAGAHYVIDLGGFDSNAGSLPDAYLRLHDATGAVIGQNDDGGPGFDSQLIYTVATSGTYYIEAGAFGDAYAGTYRVGVSGDVTPDPDGMPLVDDRYYNARYPDVAAAGVDPEQHYHANGWHEGRDPNGFFSTTGYLAANADVRAAGFDPLTHYDSNGWHEGRDPSAAFDDELYLARNPDVAQAGIDPLAHYLANGQSEGRQAYAAVGRAGDVAAAHGFDAEYYLLSNPDVARAAIQAGGDSFAFAYQHYETNGWHEGRNPNAVFDVRGYLTAYADVRAANIDPLAHYDTNGWREGRDPSANFDTRAYESHYGDIAAAGIDPLTHYLTHGALEGRSAFADGHFA